MGIINRAKTSAKAQGHFHVCIRDPVGGSQVSGRGRESAGTKLETREETVKTQMTYLARNLHSPPSHSVVKTGIPRCNLNANQVCLRAAAIKQSPPLERDLQNTFLPLSFSLVPAKLEAKNGVDTTNIGFIIAPVHRFATVSIHWTPNDGLYERNERFYSLCHTDQPNENRRTLPISAKT